MIFTQRFNTHNLFQPAYMRSVLPVCSKCMFRQSTWAPSVCNIQRPYSGFLSETSSEPDQYYKQHVFLHDFTRISIGTLEVHNNIWYRKASYTGELCKNQSVALTCSSEPFYRTILSQLFNQYSDYKHVWLAESDRLRKYAIKTLLKDVSSMGCHGLSQTFRVGFCTLCFYFPTKMLQLNAPT